MSPTASPRNPDRPANVERPIRTYNGFVMLAIGLALLASAVWQLVSLVGAGRPSLAAIAVEGAKVHRDLALLVRAVADGEQDLVSLVSLDVLEVLDEHRLVDADEVTL